MTTFLLACMRTGVWLQAYVSSCLRVRYTYAYLQNGYVYTLNLTIASVQAYVRKDTTMAKTMEAKFDKVTGRRLLDQSYSGQKEMLACGWTQEQIDALVDAPRSTSDVEHPEEWLPVGDGTDNVIMPEGAEWHWAKVDGFAVCGTSLLNKEEKARYRAYEKAKSAGRALTSSTSRKAVKDMDKWQALLEQVKNDPIAVQMVRDLMPKAKPTSEYTKLTGKDVVDDTEWTLFGLMYASVDGERKPDLQPEELPALLMNGWAPVRLAADVTKAIASLKNKGIDSVEENGKIRFVMA